MTSTGRPPSDADTVLVRVSGPDRPGILAGVLAIMAAATSEVQDIEQITIRGHLDLSLVVTVPGGRDLLKELLLFGWENQIEVAFEVVDPRPTVRGRQLVVTVLGRHLGPGELGGVAAAVAGAGGNIERIVRLSCEPVYSYELHVAGGDADRLREALLAVSQRHGVDVAVQTEGLLRRASRVVVMDVDSTLIQDEVIDLLAEAAGREEEVAAVTAAAMAGEIDFEESLRRRVAALAGLPVSVLGEVRDRVRLTPGARTFVRTLRRLGYRTAIVSGGFTAVTDHLRQELGLDYAFANELEVAHGRLTGGLVGPIVDRAAKARIAAEIAAREGVSLDQVVAIGDGANDLDMLAVAGLGVAFNAKPAVRQAARASVNVPYLDAILFLLGVSRDEVTDLD
jgi:phosphoserine phosphatase